MERENIFDYFNDIKIISNHDGYFYSVKESLIEEYGTEKPLTIAIEGKSIRSTDKMSRYESPLHIVSAQVAEFGITLAQKYVKGTTNEIHN